jgi:hypothetical protein
MRPVRDAVSRLISLNEEIRGGEATLIGLMTESDEDSLKQAEANIGKPVAGDRAFKVIRATIAGDQARSIVTRGLTHNGRVAAIRRSGRGEWPCGISIEARKRQRCGPPSLFGLVCQLSLIGPGRHH